METSGGCFKRGITVALVAIFVGLVLAACGPEAERTRGDGPGADPGNHAATPQLQGSLPAPTRIYFDTPRDALPIATP